MGRKVVKAVNGRAEIDTGLQNRALCDILEPLQPLPLPRGTTLLLRPLLPLWKLGHTLFSTVFLTDSRARIDYKL